MNRTGHRLYGLLLLAFPAAFRRRHAADMRTQFESQHEATRAYSVARARLWMRAAIDALWHGLALRSERLRATWHTSLGHLSNRGGAARRLSIADVFAAVMQDCRYAARGLRRDWRVTAIVVLILTAGIGANAIMFGVVDQMLLRAPGSIGHAEGVRRVYFGSDPAAGRPAATAHSYPVIAAVRAGVTAFVATSAIARADVALDIGPAARPVSVELVNAAYFPLLELHPAAGRFFTIDEDAVPHGAAVAVISHGFWQREHGGERTVIGREVRLDGAPFTIIGVAPADFTGIDRRPVDLWVPIGALAPSLFGSTWHANPGRYAFELIARLAPGATTELADAQATDGYRRVSMSMPGPTADPRNVAFVASLEGRRAPNGLPADGRVGLWLLGVAAAVLLIASANVATILLTRTLARRREIAVRLAIGVSRARLVRLLLTESTLLCAISALAAVGVAYFGARLVQQLLLPGFAWSDRVIDVRVLAVTGAVSLLAALLAGVAPALQALATDVTASLRSMPRVASGRIGWIRSGLLAAQISLCVVLLVGAGLFVRSLEAVRDADIGIDLDRVVVAVLPDRAGTPRAQLEATYALASGRVSALPGVSHVAIARGSAPSRSHVAISLRRDGDAPGDLRGRSAPFYSAITDGYFATLGAVLERGRDLSLEDHRTGARVMVINRALARQRWSGADPLGDCVFLGADTVCTTVVGLVETIMVSDRTEAERGHLYVPASHPMATGARARALFVRSERDAEGAVPLVRQALQSLSPDMLFVSVDTMERVVAPQLRPWRLGSTMFALFGVVALAIASVGLYGAMSYTVSQRRHEIGVRMALGASRWQIVSDVSRHSAAIVGAGLVAGTAGAFFGSPWLEGLLYRTPPHDPFVFAIVAAVLAIAGLSATIVPARRSAAVDPLVVLKAD